MNQDDKEELLTEILCDLVIDTALEDAANVNNSSEDEQREWLLGSGWSEKELTARIEEMMELDK